MMNTTQLSHPRKIARMSAVLALLGVFMIGTSFSINNGPGAGATNAQLVQFGQLHTHAVLFGAWLQAVGPILIVTFAVALVLLSNALHRLSGLMTLIGSVILVMVSLMEVVIYISALNTNFLPMATISADLGHAIQHLYFIAAAPALFVPLGFMLRSANVLPRTFAYLSLALGAAFIVVGLTSLHTMVLSPLDTSLAGVQSLWWIGAAIALLVRARKLPIRQQET